MSSAFSARWLASWEVISKYYSPPSSKRDKIAHNNLIFDNFLVYWQKLNNFLGFCVEHTESIIHLSVGESDGYIPRRLAARWISNTSHLHLGE